MADGSVKIDIVADDSDIKKKLDSVEDAAEDAADKLDDLGDSSQKSGKGFDIASVAIGNFISNGVTALIGKVGEAISSLIALADETREYREDMAKLNTAFKSAGHSTETAQKAYDDFYKILGESDRSVEAVNHLAELTDNTEEVAKWSDIAAGVTAKFGDSLPIEGLTEAANETAKVGAVTGPLADALNWAGISEEKFNEQLKKCNSEQERATLITNTLSKEYETAAAEYNTLTAGAQAAREATNRMEQAQAALGASIEPVTTAWTNMKATALGWLAEGLTPIITNTLEAARGTDVLSESQRASVTAAHEAAAAYRETKNAVHELALAQLADVDYATNYLLPQLQELVDANGRVKQGYEERANFILGQLNEAYGTEYTRISEIVGKNGELKQSILDTIEAKKAQILLAAHEEEYKNAVQNVAEAERVRAQQATYLAEQSAVVEKAEQALKKVRDEVAEAAQKGDTATVRSKGEMVKNLQAELDKEVGVLEKLQDEYNTSEKNIFGYYEDINSYQTASTLLMEGKTAEAIGYLNNLSAGYETTTGNVQGSIEEQREALAQQVIDTEVNAQLMKEAYQKGVKGVSEEMVKTAEAQAAQAKEQFYNVGGDITKGIAEGAEGEENSNYTLSGAMTRLVNKALEAAKKAGIIKSPSRLFRDEVGKMIAAGIEVGIEQDADKPAEAVKGVFDSMKKVLDKEQKNAVETVKEYNVEMLEEVNDHNWERQKLDKDLSDKLLEIDEKYADAKKKKGADKIKLEKEYQKECLKVNTDYDLAVEKENERHAASIEKIQDNIKNTISGKMQEIVSLEEKYKEDTKKVFEDLGNSIDQLTQNYEDQLKSRTESIASSLGLWNEATKNKTAGIVLQKNLQSQVAVLEDYNEAIAKLEERNVSTAFINSLKEMGVASTGEIEAIAKMTDKQLNAYVELWEKKNELARNAAVEELEPLKAETEAKIEELTNAALDKYAELRAEYQAQGSLLMAELKQAMITAGQGGYEEIIGQIDEYTTAGEDLMSGVVAGIVDKSPAVVNAVKSAVKRAIQAAKDAAGIASPSKVMKKEVGANLAEGVNVGWADKIDAVKSKMATDMQGITARIKTAVSLEQSRMAQGVGVRDTGFAEVAQAVGMQTAGINSLASEYRRGSNAQVTVPLILDGRELGRAVVDLGNAETIRTGTNLVLA